MSIEVFIDNLYNLNVHIYKTFFFIKKIKHQHLQLVKKKLFINKTMNTI